MRSLAEAMAPYPAPWAIAGGWALELFADQLARPHADLDVAVFRDDHAKLRRTLASWTFLRVRDGQLEPWIAGEPLNAPVHEVHASAPDGLTVEFLLDERLGSDWVYRRDQRIRKPLGESILFASSFPVLAPEIVLLFKSKEPRPTDSSDFAAVLPLLSRAQVAWLRRALELCSPGHEWLAMLS